MQLNDTFLDYSSHHISAKHALVSGHKDTGLRMLWALHHDLAQAPDEDDDVQRLKNLLDDTIYRWGEGFDWD